MTKAFALAILALALALASSPVTQAQGTIYVSSLGLPSTGSTSVGNDSWLAAGFRTGTNVDGYLLNSVQLLLTSASGSPSGFTAMIYNQNPDIIVGLAPGSSLGTLNGSLDPVAGGIYTYSPAPDLVLSPGTYYFIVLTAGTAVADGAYEWSATSAGGTVLSGGWNAGGSFSSPDGLEWGGHATPPPDQFAISATAIPEPSTFGLLALGGFLLARRRLNAKPLVKP